MVRLHFKRSEEYGVSFHCYYFLVWSGVVLHAVVPSIGQIGLFKNIRIREDRVQKNPLKKKLRKKCIQERIMNAIPEPLGMK